MRKITSNGGKSYLQCMLSGDLPFEQGPPRTNAIRMVRMESDGGHIGVDEFVSLQRVWFGEQGQPTMLNDVQLSTGGHTDLRARDTFKKLLAECEAATRLPVIDLLP